MAQIAVETTTGAQAKADAALAAAKTYANAVAQGLSPKASVRVATTVPLASFTGLGTIDGVALSDGDRVLVKDQSVTPQGNGIYVAHAGAWARATDADSQADLLGAYVLVEGGTTNAGSGWVMDSPAPITVDTTPLAWFRFSGINVFATATATGRAAAFSLIFGG